MKISPARAAAFDILMRIERDGAFSSALLPVYEEKLSEKDSALCHELTLGVLRRKLWLDAIVDHFSKNKRIDLEVRISLHLGLFQMTELDRVPAHAAIDESVNLVVRAKKSSAKGFVNAILRAFQREPVVLHLIDPVEDVSLSTSHPKWLVERWIEQFGIETAVAICKGNNEVPKIAFRVINNGDKRISELEKAGEIRRSDIVSNCFLAPRLTPALRELATDNAIYFQDTGAQLVGQSVISVAGNRILDVCAAPGGKTSMFALTGSLVAAGDIHFPRVERLRETCRLHSVDVSIVQLDAENALPFRAESFDTVFVDAPCTGTGTIRHNPEIRYFLIPDDPASLSQKQLRILRNASELVADNGALIYSTCSLEQEENEAVAGDFLENNDNFQAERPKVDERFITETGFARTFPHRDAMDGFFIAVFRRI